MDFRSISIEEYRPAPFWFLNHKLEKDELKRQVRLMKEAGNSGFFMHPRAGLKTPYGSNAWYEMIQAIIDESKAQGLKAWLYDEDPFPSGIAGGKVVFDNPLFRARYLAFLEAKPDADGKVFLKLGTGKLLSVVAVKRKADGGVGEIINLKDEVGILREDYFKCRLNTAYYATLENVEYLHPRAETFYPEQVLDYQLDGSDWEVIAATANITMDGDKYGCRPDNLSEESVAYFIELTHAEYQRRFGDDFGDTILGIFTDEPAAGGLIPWTGNVESEFKAIKGYDLASNYFHIVSNFGEESKKVREDYLDVICGLYKKNYLEQIDTWCKKHNLKTTGHICCEEDPIYQNLLGMNVYTSQQFFDIPAFDVVTMNIGNVEHPVLSFGGKLVASAAHQQGKRTIASECFACAPWNFETNSMLKTANWLYAIGITWLVPHGFFYSIDGDRKFDAGKAFSFQDPYYKDFNWFADYSARLGGLLAKSDHITKTAVLYQVSSYRQELPANFAKAQQLSKQHYDVMQKLFSAQIEFDYIDEETLLASEIVDNEIVCGNERYSMIIIPMPNDLGQRGRECLSKLQSANFKTILADPENKFVQTAKNEGAVWSDITPLRKDSNAEHIMVQLKELDGEKLIYIFNNSLKPGWFNLKCPSGNFAYLYDTGTGEYQKVNINNGSIDFAIEGYKALVFTFTESEIDTAQVYNMPESLEDTVLIGEVDPVWDYPMLGDNICDIARWDIKVAGDLINKEFKNSEMCLLRDLVGTELPHVIYRSARPGMDMAPMVKSHYPLKAEYSADININLKNGKYMLVFENDTFVGNAQMTINGHNIDLSKATRKLVYDPFNMVLELDNVLKHGANTVKVLYAEAREFDGIRSSIYIAPASELNR